MMCYAVGSYFRFWTIQNNEQSGSSIERGGLRSMTLWVRMKSLPSCEDRTKLVMMEGMKRLEKEYFSCGNRKNDIINCWLVHLGKEGDD